MADAVKLFKSLSDETRLRILNLLGERDLCVCHIVEALGLGQSKVSRHLAHLRNADLVTDRREGLWMYYSLAEPQSGLHEQLLALLKQSASELPMAAIDVTALKSLSQCSDLCGDDSTNRQDDPRAGAAVNASDGDRRGADCPPASKRKNNTKAR